MERKLQAQIGLYTLLLIENYWNLQFDVNKLVPSKLIFVIETWMCAQNNIFAKENLSYFE